MMVNTVKLPAQIAKWPASQDMMLKTQETAKS